MHWSRLSDGRRALITVPPGFAESTIAREGDAGAAWLDALPATVETVCERWGLQVDGAVMHGYVAVVVPVVRDGMELALKVSWVDQSSEQEPLVLRAWKGRGAVRLHESAWDVGALLLERLRFDRTLGHVDVAAAAQIAGSLLRRLAIPAPAELRRTSQEYSRLQVEMPADWGALGGPFSRDVLDGALEVLGQPSGTAQQPAVIVNTDLHYENVLAGKREPWLVIDPKALAGEVEFAVAQLLWSRTEGLGSKADLERRFSIVCEAAQVDENRARELSLVRLVDYWLWAVKMELSEDRERCRSLVGWLYPRLAG